MECIDRSAGASTIPVVYILGTINLSNTSHVFARLCHSLHLSPVGESILEGDHGDRE